MSCNPGASAYNFVLVLFSIIFGIGIAALFAFGLIPSIVTGVYIALIITGVLLLAAIARVEVAGSTNAPAIARCLRYFGVSTVIAALGTIVFATAALSISLVPTVVPIIVVFFVAFFYMLFLTSLGSLLICTIRNS